MKAAVVRRFGSLDNVRVADVPEPKPGPDEVVLAVRSAALNHLDIWVCKGRGGLNVLMPHVLGSDCAGVVAAKGPGVSGVEVGDTVVVYPGLTCGVCEFCRSGQQSLCADFGIIGMSCPGTFAEQVAVPAKNVYPRPAHLTDAEAGGLVLAHLTAWRMLTTRGQVCPGQSVLIHGIGGGVALAALQLAKLIDAEVTVTSGSDEKLERAKKLGADHMINYKKTTDVAAQVRDITSGRGVDVAIDSVGAGTWGIDLAAVRRGGKVVLCGVTSGADASTNLRAVYWNQLTILGSTLGSAEDLRQMLRAVTVAQLRPIVDSALPLAKAREAMRRMETGQQFGKIVLTVPE